MKKAESQKTPFTTRSASHSVAHPVLPAPADNRTAQQAGADPSSCFRSSRYPVPQFEFRTPAAR